MIVTIHTETHDEADAIMELCRISDLTTYDFVDTDDDHDHGVQLGIHSFADRLVGGHIIDFAQKYIVGIVGEVK